MIVGSPSQAPAIVDALNDLVTDASAFSGIQVVDGPILDLEQLEDDAVCIAAGTPAEPGFTSSFQEQNNLGRRSYIEVVTINVTVSARVLDNTDMRARRGRVRELLTDLQALLTANRVADGVWDDIGFGSEAAWHQVATTRGAVCVAGILIEARALI